MKKMKKLVCLFLAMVLTMSMAMTVFASETGDESGDDSTTGEFTIQLAGSDATPTTGHKYSVYQIFTGDLHNGKLSNIKYGENYGATGEKVDKDDINAITDADAFAKSIATKLNGVYGELNAGNNWKLEKKVPAGYYLIVDTTEKLPDGHERSRYIVEVVEDVNVAPKSGVLSVIKKVDDKNDSTGEEDAIVWHDSADHDLGDMIDFKIETTLPADLMTYETYELTLHDTQSEGLTFIPSTVKVYVDDSTTPLTAGYDVVTENKEHSTCTFEIKFDDVTELAGVENNSVITVRYQSRLNEDAVMGSTGNPNEVYGEFSNSYFPNDKGKTPVDRVIVFTYKVNVDKYKESVEEGNELSGAEFTLYKEVPKDTDNASLGSTIKKDFPSNVSAKALKDNSYYITITSIKADADEDTFGFERIDDGIYVLVETLIPAGYNAWDAVEFEITAEHDILSDNPTLVTLEGGDLFTGEVSTGVLDTDIVNNAGATLPTTGGMGTTMFYVIGAILAIGAAVVMITKKRMSAE